MANTLAPLSEVAICNMGADILEDVAITSLDDNTQFARLCAREFGYLRNELLRAHPWSFNKAMKLLAPDTEAPPFRWKYAYTLPTDCLRVYPIREFNNGRKIPYEMFGRKIYTNYKDALPVIYGRKVTNAVAFDPLFARALGCRLGVLGAQRITGKTNYLDKAREMFAEAMQTAIHVNSLENGSDDYIDNGYEGFGLDVLNVRGIGFADGSSSSQN